MKKIVSIIGARPQFVKAAMMSQEIQKHSDIQEIVIHTGQHFDNNMSQLFFNEMGIRQPDYNLDIHSLPHGAMTGRMMDKIEEILMIQQPDAVMVYGDTDSTLAGALAAKKLLIKVIHVEAGLRSFNMKMPEEINRVLTDRVSDLLFCPTDTAMRNLHQEGIDTLGAKIVKTGDIMKDAALHFASKARQPNHDLPDHFALCTLHRAENTDNLSILTQLMLTLETACDIIPVVIPLHPRTKQQLLAAHYDLDYSPVTFLEPVGYLEMLYLLQHSSIVLTDSGGLQKEAYFFHKGCLTLRSETEWTELVENHYNQIVGHDTNLILSSLSNNLQKMPTFKDNLYGDGHAAAFMLSQIVDNL